MLKFLKSLFIKDEQKIESLNSFGRGGTYIGGGIKKEDNVVESLGFLETTELSCVSCTPVRVVSKLDKNLNETSTTIYTQDDLSIELEDLQANQTLKFGDSEKEEPLISDCVKTRELVIRLDNSQNITGNTTFLSRTRNWTLQSWCINDVDVLGGVPVNLGAFANYTLQNNALVNLFNSNDPYNGGDWQNVNRPAREWRGQEVRHCNPEVVYGPATFTDTTGLTAILNPYEREDAIERCYDRVVVREPYTNKLKTKFLDTKDAGIEYDVDPTCCVKCDYEFPDPIKMDTSCTIGEESILCDENEKFVRTYTICNGVTEFQNYTFASWVSAVDPDGLVTYTPIVSSLQICPDCNLISSRCILDTTTNTKYKENIYDCDGIASTVILDQDDNITTLENEYIYCDEVADGPFCDKDLDYYTNLNIENSSETIETSKHFISLNFSPPSTLPTGSSITWNGSTVTIPSDIEFDETPCNDNSTATSQSFVDWVNAQFSGAQFEYVPGSGCDAIWACGPWSLNLGGTVVDGQSVLDIDPDFPDALCTIESVNNGGIDVNDFKGFGELVRLDQCTFNQLARLPQVAEIKGCLNNEINEEINNPHSINSNGWIFADETDELSILFNQAITNGNETITMFYDNDRDGVCESTYTFNVSALSYNGTNDRWEISDNSHNWTQSQEGIVCSIESGVKVGVKILQKINPVTLDIDLLRVFSLDGQTEYTNIENLEFDCGSIRTCFENTGICKCLPVGVATGDSFTYINADNNTDISFSNNTTTIKWSIELGQEADADATGPFINDCINNGGVASMTITDAEGNVFTFDADTLISDGTATGGWVFQGNATSGTGSGKLRQVVINCSEGGTGSGKAYLYRDCENDAEEWRFEDGTKLSEEQLASLEECKDCPIDIIQIIRCSTETLPPVSTGDQILTIAKRDCDNVILDSTNYLLSTGEELSVAVLTEDCDPAPDVETIRGCITDTNGINWTVIAIIDPDTNEPINTFYVNQSNLEIGTPSGEEDEWTDCSTDCLDTEIICYCVVSKGVVKGETKGKSKETQENKPGKILEVCEERRYDCSGEHVFSTFLYQGKQFSQEQFDKANLQIVPCNTPDKTYTAGAVTCATEVVDGTTIVLNVTVFTNESDPTDTFTQYTLADDYPSIGDLGDLYTPTDENNVTACPPGSITETEECYEALVDIKGVANAGDTITVIATTNTIAGTTYYVITHSSSGSEVYSGGDPVGDAGIDVNDAATWNGPVDCQPLVEEGKKVIACKDYCQE